MALGVFLPPPWGLGWPLLRASAVPRCRDVHRRQNGRGAAAAPSSSSAAGLGASWGCRRARGSPGASALISTCQSSPGRSGPGQGVVAFPGALTAQNHHWGLLTVLGGQPCARKGASLIPASLQSLLPTSTAGWGATRGLPVWYSAQGGMWRQWDPAQRPAPRLGVFLSSPGLQGCLAKARSGRKIN